MTQLIKVKPKVLIIKTEISTKLIMNKIFSEKIGTPKFKRNEYFSVRISGFIINAAQGAIRPIPKTSRIWKNNEIIEIGLRSGEKLHECMIAEAESLNTWESNDFYIIKNNYELENVVKIILN